MHHFSFAYYIVDKFEMPYNYYMAEIEIDFRDIVNMSAQSSINEYSILYNYNVATLRSDGSLLNGTYTSNLPDNSVIKMTFKNGLYHGQGQRLKDGKFVGHGCTYEHGYSMDHEFKDTLTAEFIRWMKGKNISFDRTTWTEEQWTEILLTWG